MTTYRHFLISTGFSEGRKPDIISITGHASLLRYYYLYTYTILYFLRLIFG